jgi:hypothetical protein
LRLHEPGANRDAPRSHDSAATLEKPSEVVRNGPTNRIVPALQDLPAQRSVGERQELIDRHRWEPSQADTARAARLREAISPGSARLATYVGHGGRCARDRRTRRNTRTRRAGARSPRRIGHRACGRLWRTGRVDGQTLVMPRAQSAEKMCQKCKSRKPRAAFLVSVSDGTANPSFATSLFCVECRMTFQTCTRCGVSKAINEFSRDRGARHGWCKSCHGAARLRLYTAARERRTKKWQEKHGSDLPPPPSWYDQDPEDVLRLSRRRRAERMKAARRDPVDRLAIFERDTWICGICGGAVEPDDATLDHIQPISLGGLHEPANLRLAHSVCNSRRGDGRARCR